MYAALVTQIWDWMEQFAFNYGYPGIFIIGLIGASSIVFPIPYHLIIYVLGSVLDPLLVAIASGLGSAIGELTGYILGYYGRTIIGKERQRKIDFMLRVLNRYGLVVIFFFALTPLPDDLLFIPLGIAHYNLIRALLPSILGKVLMSLILALGGRLSIEFIKDWFAGGEWWMILITMALLILFIASMLKIDWEKFFYKYVEKDKRESV